MTLHFQFHPVVVPVRRVPALEPIFRSIQVVAYLLEGTRVFLVTLEMLLQEVRNILQTHPLALLHQIGTVLCSHTGFLHNSHQHLTKSVQLLVLQVVLHQGALLILCEPVALALTDLVYQLGIEQVVLNGCLKVDITVDEYTEEPA